MNSRNWYLEMPKKPYRYGAFGAYNKFIEMISGISHGLKYILIYNIKLTKKR